MSGTPAATLVAAEEATVAAARLGQAWPWLTAARLPGPTSRRAGRRHRTAGSPAPVRLGPVTARAAIAAHLTTLTTVIAADITGTYPPGPVGDPQTVRPCPRCTTVGRCGCDRPDHTVTTCLGWLTRTLPKLTSPATAGHARAVLQGCDETARAVSGATDPPQPIRAACPACGRRSLYVEVVTAAGWVAACAWPGCGCTGPGCGCGRAIRWPGRRHLWPAAEWATLAAQLHLPPQPWLVGP